MICLIPARGGSKGIPNKNIVDLNGKPLIAYSIKIALNLKQKPRIIVTTDSEEIADVAREYGAEVPFMRPAEFATDTSTDYDVVKHALDWLKKNESYGPEYIIYLRPTTPIRDVALVDEATEYIRFYLESTCMRSAHETRESPYKLFGEEGDYFVGLYPNIPIQEYYNLPRQAFPKVYQPNGYVDIWKRETVEKGSLHGDKILKFITPEVIEIDRPEDLELLRKTI